jgi:hypothetical protein
MLALVEEMEEEENEATLTNLVKYSPVKYSQIILHHLHNREAWTGLEPVTTYKWL